MQEIRKPLHQHVSQAQMTKAQEVELSVIKYVYDKYKTITQLNADEFWNQVITVEPEEIGKHLKFPKKITKQASIKNQVKAGYIKIVKKGEGARSGELIQVNPHYAFAGDDSCFKTVLEQFNNGLQPTEVQNLNVELFKAQKENEELKKQVSDLKKQVAELLKPMRTDLEF